MSVLGTLILVALSVRPQQDARAVRTPECREWHECRQLALDAFGRGEYETFHDLAWRSVQTGPPHDPDLMYLLARAQTLSGRPHDALVMLGRLAEMGVASDASTNDEFRGVRALRDWPQVEALIAAAGRKASAPIAPTSPTATAVSPAPSSEPSSTLPPAEVARSKTAIVDALSLPRALAHPSGLAYDGISGRFLVADRAARKLVIVDERSHQAVDLVRDSSAGFLDITAFEIDARRGDLWVVSADPSNANSSSDSATALHKLQLVSGRPLEKLTMPGQLLPARFEDVAVTARGTVLVLDIVGHRIFSVQPQARSFALAATLGVEAAASIAPADDRIVYVAHASGIDALDTSTGTSAPLHGPANVQLAGFVRIRWHDDSLVGIQRVATGFRLVALRLSGNRVVSARVLAPDLALADPASATLAADDVYVLAHRRENDSGAGEFIVQRIHLN